MLAAFSSLPQLHAANGPLPVPKIMAPAAALPVAIAPNNSLIKYVGRFDYSDPAGPQFQWTASAETVRFTASSINVRIKETSANIRYEVVVDGAITAVLAPSAGVQIYNVWSGASGTHTLSIVRRNEFYFGISQFQGFELSSGGSLTSLPASNGRAIEVIGDSISCGYGDEALATFDGNTADNEDGYRTYGGVAAAAVGADYHCIAAGGKKMYPDNTIGEVYDRILPSNTSSVWNFAGWNPGAVVIMLGTNDFKTRNLDTNAWIAAYEQFIVRLRTHYPNATIYCSTSPMQAEPTWTNLYNCLQTIVQDRHNAGDSRVTILSVPNQNPAVDGFAGDYHPSISTHRKDAAILAAALASDLGWTAPPFQPIDLAATPGNGQAALSWTASSGATSYNVKRATAPDGPYMTVGSPSTSSYTDSGVVNGITYYFVVSAVSASGESTNSSRVSVTPNAVIPPLPPKNLTATKASQPGKINLSWTQSATAGVTLNNIYRSTNSGGPYSLVTTVNATTSYSNTGLTGGTTYYYVVTALSSSGESGYSNQASATAK
jgi:lysophospholipase L1-like esterase